MSARDPKTGLTLKQAAFVREYAKDRNGKEAAIRAGYAPNYADRQAYQLLEHPRVMKAIEAQEAELREETGVTVASLTDSLLKAASQAMEHGRESAVAQNLRLAAQLHGLLIEKQEVTTQESFVIEAPAQKSVEDWQAEMQAVVTAQKGEQEGNNRLN